jgi:ubiquitin-activating enzyme E1
MNTDLHSISGEFSEKSFSLKKLNDDHRYSRQSYSIGRDVMLKLNNSFVLIVGYNILSQEIIKNLVLLGINNIDIFQNSNLQNYEKTGLYYSENEYLNKLRELNPTININSIENVNDGIDFYKKYNLVILINYYSIEEAIKINNITNELNIGFMMTGCYGLLGYTFNDFGKNFVINDIDGEEYENLIVEKIENKIITFKDPHKLGEKDTLLLNNDKEIIVKNTQTPLIIEVLEEIDQNINNYKSLIKKKKQQILNFKSLEESLKKIDYVISDFSVSFNRSEHLHLLNLAYDNFRNINLLDISYNTFKKYINLENNQNNNEIIELAKKFYYTSNGNLLPFASIIGGIVSQEVLKFLGHKFIPIEQWYYIDFLDLVDDNINQDNNLINNKLENKLDNKYEGLINIFGEELLNKIQDTKPFIVGCGAIGCELLKNIGMLGIKNIVTTDMDNIEISNLSRQFLFNDKDVLKSKSQTAAKKIKSMVNNDNINIIVYENKICKESEDIFNKEFHDNIDIYLNALDNIDARKYMDNQAIKYEKPLIDSGTMGSSGNVQVVIPHLTETYGSTTDPDDQTKIPICTLKSFPYKPEHTIQWARELFENEFIVIPNLIEKYRDNEELYKLNEVDRNLLLKQLTKYINFRINEESYIRLLSTIYYENFEKPIEELIEKYKDDIENNKKLPQKLKLSKKLIKNFMRSGCNILNQIFNSNIIINNIEINPMTLNVNKLTENIEIIKNILELIPSINKISFDKDNDELEHIYWINECSNIRNKQYSITETDIYQTRKIAGKIIPAMITTTSLIAGFQVMEFIKIIKYYNKNNSTNKNYYKNRFANLNINYCDGIEPSSCKKYDNLSTWSKITVFSRETNKIIEEIKEKYNKKVEFITLGNKTVFDGDDILIENIDKNNEILILLEDIPIELSLIIE